MPRKTSPRIRIGIGGWSYAPWRGGFYPPDLPQKRELEYASSRLTSIEINSTFYGSQKPASFARWHAETPEDFVFAVKAPMFATHRRVLASAGDSIARFFGSGVLLLGRKLGPVNWQFGPQVPFDAEDFEAFLSLLPRKLEGLALRHAVEVRNASFVTPAFSLLARKYKVAIVLAGDSKFPEITQENAPFIYARIMGTTARYKAGYPAGKLDAWASRAQAWAAAKQEVFLYVISGCKQRNPGAAMALIQRVAPRAS
jgi:uncharacterized protein YecE (DUF72 family)